MSLVSTLKKHAYIWYLRGLNKQIRMSAPYRICVERVKRRDNYQCTNCHTKNKRLYVHHLDPFIRIVKLYKIRSIYDAYRCERLWDITNMVLLCEDCHKKTDSYKRKIV